MRREEYAIMAAAEPVHWWYRCLHELVLKQLQIYSNSKDIRIIDAGCGTGGLMKFLQDKGYDNISGFDVSDEAVSICQANKLPVFKSDLREIAKHFEPASADIIISNDTFYFLNSGEQKQLACDFNLLLKPGGMVISNIPALQAFRGIHDVQVGITNRFHKKQVSKVFEPALFAVISQRYWPFILSPFIWFTRLTQRIKLKMNPARPIQSDLIKGNRYVNTILFSLTYAENEFLPYKPFGSSLFLVMKKNH